MWLICVTDTIGCRTPTRSTCTSRSRTPLDCRRRWFSFDHGGLLAYCADPTQILTEIGEVRPTYLPSVPRIYEKIYTLATEPIEKAPPGQLEQFRKAVEIGLRCERCSCGASRSR